MFFFIELLGVIAIYNWKTTEKDKRFVITLQTSETKPSKKSEKFLAIILIISMIFASTSIMYIIVTPVTGEPFTDFYILSSNSDVTNFPQDILAGEKTNITLGLINHEYVTMNYTIEIWLVEESVVFNRTTKENTTLYHHAWFMKKFDITLQHTEITNKKNQTKKWESTYTFQINKIGFFKLVFLLFTTPSENFNLEQDYKDSIDKRIKSAYRELHLWLYVG